MENTRNMFESFERYENQIIEKRFGFLNFPKLDSSGIYVFWIQKNDLPEDINQEILLKGPSETDVSISLDWNLEKEWIPVYVGKTTNIKQRIGWHLKMGTDSSKYKTRENKKIKLATSDQLRAGLEHLLKNQNVIEFIRTHLYVSFVPIPDVAERFYFEDYLIGKYCPWFNLDSER